MKKTIFDLQTQQTTTVDMTQEEIIAIQASLQSTASEPEPEVARIDAGAVYLPENATYQERRQVSYPSFLEYIDGVVKGDQSQIDAYIADCLAVKARYPKPE